MDCDRINDRSISQTFETFGLLADPVFALGFVCIILELHDLVDERSLKEWLTFNE